MQIVTEARPRDRKSATRGLLVLYRLCQNGGPLSDDARAPDASVTLPSPPYSWFEAEPKFHK